MRLEDVALIMSNARRLIKAKSKTSNAALYMQLFGSGRGTAVMECRALGINPDSNKTCYSSMMEHLRRENELIQQTH